MQEPNPNPKPQNEVEEHEQLECPRCFSKNTKFCYYNNYKLSQPRHYCKTCRRYWTKGGLLRNITAGGGSRRSSGKRATSSKMVILKATTSPATPSSVVVDLPLANTVLTDAEGYFDNFKVGFWGYTGPDMPNSVESSFNGGNSGYEGLLTFNGDLNMFFVGWC